MNPQIQELALEAAGTKKYVPPVWQFFDDELKRFAELIIKDCANIVQDSVDQRIPASEYPGIIKKHFGVEE